MRYRCNNFPAIHLKTSGDIPVNWKEGWCLNRAGRDQNSGVIGLGTMSLPTCVESCIRKKRSATGCEYNKQNNQCSVHTRDVGSASGGTAGHLCLKLSGKNPKKIIAQNDILRSHTIFGSSSFF